MTGLVHALQMHQMLRLHHLHQTLIKALSLFLFRGNRTIGVGFANYYKCNMCCTRIEKEKTKPLSFFRMITMSF